MQTKIGADANVTSLMPYLTHSANPVLTELLSYWERLRAGRIAPLRSEVDPNQIEDVLEHAFILEQIDQQVPRFRIAGMNICDLMGMEIRAMPATSVILPACRKEFVHLLQGLFKRPEILELKLASKAPLEVTGEMLLLPMQASPGEVTRILGCLVTSGHAEKTPVRFNITSKKHTRIVATTNAPQLSDAMGFAEPSTAFIAHKVSSKAPVEGDSPCSYLRLVKTDK